MVRGLILALALALPAWAGPCDPFAVDWTVSPPRVHTPTPLLIWDAYTDPGMQWQVDYYTLQATLHDPDGPFAEWVDVADIGCFAFTALDDFGNPYTVWKCPGTEKWWNPQRHSAIPTQRYQSVFETIEIWYRVTATTASGYESPPSNPVKICNPPLREF